MFELNKYLRPRADCGRFHDRRSSASTDAIEFLDRITHQRQYLLQHIPALDGEAKVVQKYMSRLQLRQQPRRTEPVRWQLTSHEILKAHAILLFVLSICRQSGAAATDICSYMTIFTLALTTFGGRKVGKYLAIPDQ